MRRVGTLLLTLFALFGLVAPAAHADTDHSRGPDPTESFIEQTRGSYSVDERSISRFAADGFNGGTMYYPTGTEEYSIAWLKRHLDGDTRYEQFIDPGPDTGWRTGISDWRLD